MINELRDPQDARRYLLQGLWLQRVQTPRAQTVAAVLEWAAELGGAGEPLPPLGFVADVGHMAFQAETALSRDAAVAPGWPHGITRTYEDYVLGRLLTDSAFERACDALRHYQGRDRARGLAFLLSQLRQHAGFGGVLLTPAVFKALRDRPGEEILAEGWESLTQEGPLPLLASLYEDLITHVRHAPALLGAEDVFELEHRTALAPFSQRVALRQVLQATAALEAGLPTQPLRPRAERPDAATRILDEDLYPVGGFSSISNRGSIESLLHSQLSYMEDERPDLFDIKYLRDELLFYSRDENQFLRRRRTFVFVFHPDLMQARFKDAELPWQRIILALAAPLALTRKLIEWLSTDALLFEFLFMQEGNALSAEKALVEMILREQIANGTVIVDDIRRSLLAGHCAERARRSLCQVLTVATQDVPLEVESVDVLRLIVEAARPEIRGAEFDDSEPAKGAIASWAAATRSIIQYCL